MLRALLRPKGVPKSSVSKFRSLEDVAHDVGNMAVASIEHTNGICVSTSTAHALLEEIKDFRRKDSIQQSEHDSEDGLEQFTWKPLNQSFAVYSYTKSPPLALTE